MDTATRVLIVGGMSVLAFGLLMGIPMVLARARAPRAPRYLFATHLAAIIQGGMLLSLTVVVGFSRLSAGAEATAAACLVGGVALFDVGLALNWLQGVEDGFGQKSVGNKLSASGTPLVLLGAGILLWGVIAALA